MKILQVPRKLPWSRRHSDEKTTLKHQQTQQAKGWVGESHVHKNIMNLEGTELMQNLCNTQSNSFPFHIMKLMESGKKTTKHKQKKQPQNQNPPKPKLYKGGKTVEIKNFTSTRKDNIPKNLEGIN